MSDIQSRNDEMRPRSGEMTIDDKTRTELEAAVFRRLVEHLRVRPDVQNIDLMNLAGLPELPVELAQGRRRRRRRSADQGREPRGRLRHALRDLEVDISGHGQPRATGGDEEGPNRALTSRSPALHLILLHITCVSSSPGMCRPSTSFLRPMLSSRGMPGNKAGRADGTLMGALWMIVMFSLTQGPAISESKIGERVAFERVRRPNK